MLSWWLLLSVQFSSVAQLCPTFCDPMDCSTPGFPVCHQLPECTQTHAHWVSDAIQPSHPLSSPSPPAFNVSQHQCFISEKVQINRTETPACSLTPAYLAPFICVHTFSFSSGAVSICVPKASSCIYVLSPTMPCLPLSSLLIHICP